MRNRDGAGKLWKNCDYGPNRDDDDGDDRDDRDDDDDDDGGGVWMINPPYLCPLNNHHYGNGMIAILIMMIGGPISKREIFLFQDRIAQTSPQAKTSQVITSFVYYNFHH